VFLVVADEAAGRSVPFVFLERVREDFMQRYGSSIDEEGLHPLADDADEDDFLFEDRFSIAYNLDREFGYEIILPVKLAFCALPHGRGVCD
jgi:vesicle-associated membrane protein 72